MKIKTDTLDKLFSRCVRLLSGGYCKRCKKYAGYKKLHNAHFHSRRKHSVRWDFANTAPLCYGCHSHIDGNPYEKIEFFLGLLGQEGLKELDERAKELKPQIDRDELRAKFLENIKGLEVKE